jgi:hypothetical protein
MMKDVDVVPVIDVPSPQDRRFHPAISCQPQ